MSHCKTKSLLVAANPSQHVWFIGSYCQIQWTSDVTTSVTTDMYIYCYKYNISNQTILTHKSHDTTQFRQCAIQIARKKCEDAGIMKWNTGIMQYDSESRVTWRWQFAGGYSLKSEQTRWDKTNLVFHFSKNKKSPKRTIY